MLNLFVAIAMAIFQTQDQASVTTQLETARQLILQAFPDFSARAIEISAMVDVSPKRDVRWFPEIGLRLSEIVHRDAVQTTVPLGTVAMTFERSGMLSTWIANGPLVDSDRLDQLAKEVNAHQEWTEQQILIRLRTAGANVLPDGGITSEQRVVSSLLRLSPTIGHIEVRSVSFSYRYDTGVDNRPLRAELYWVISFSFSESSGRLRRGFAHFEPFEARMLTVSISDR